MSIDHWTLTDAKNAQVARYLYFVCTTVWTWDALTSLPDDVEMFTGRRKAWVDIIYVLSRLFTGLAVYTAIPFVVIPLVNCKVLMYTVGWLGAVAGWLSTSLFLFRVHGVFYEYLPARLFFSFMWFSAVICIIVLPSQYTGATPTPPHALCAVHSVKRFSIILLFPVAIFDWLVFVAISIRVIRIFAPHNHWRDMFKAFATGRGMGIIPKALLRTGQFYFLPILCFHGVVLWLETSPDLEHSISYQYSALLIVAGLIVMNSLACRVFRLLRQLKTGGRQPTRFRDMVSTMRFRQTTQMELDTREVNMRGQMEMETIH